MLKRNMALAALTAAPEICLSGQIRCLVPGYPDPVGLKVSLDDREPARRVCATGHSGLLLKVPPPHLKPSELPRTDRGCARTAGRAECA